jgi:hypothetical protein
MSEETAVADVVHLPATARSFAPSTDVFSDPAAFEHAQRVAKVFASSNLVPPHLKGQVADCLIAYQIARRLNEEPLTVFQNIYVVSGRPGWKTEYVIARANRAGVFRGRITWQTDGEDDEMAVTANATLAETGEAISATCDMKMARAENWTKNAKYTSMPEHMLRWRSAAMLIRLYAPEVMLGMPVLEELETMPSAMRDVSPNRSLSDKLDALADLPQTEAPSTAAEFDEDTNSTAPTETGEHSSSGAAGAGPSDPQPGPDAGGPANNKVSTSPSAKNETGPATSGQAASESETSPRNKDKEAAKAPTAAPAGVPKNEAEYIAATTMWIDALDDADAGEKRWKDEKGLRNKANVGPDAREDLQARLSQKCAEIRDADRS